MAHVTVVLKLSLAVSPTVVKFSLVPDSLAIYVYIIMFLFGSLIVFHSGSVTLVNPG